MEVLKTSKALSWDDLADLYPGIARIRPMDEIFEFFETQPDKYWVDPNEDTIHKILEQS